MGRNSSNAWSRNKRSGQNSEKLGAKARQQKLSPGRRREIAPEGDSCPLGEDQKEEDFKLSQCFNLRFWKLREVMVVAKKERSLGWQ